MSRVPSKPLALSGLAVAVVVGGDALAGAPEAGSLIENTASVSYFNTSLGIAEVLTTNTTNTIVNAVEDFTISADQAYTRTPGEAAQFVFYVENTGNTDTSVSLNFGEFQGTYNFSRVNAVVDVNGNGIADPGEPTLTSDTALSLPYGARVGIVVSVGVPDTARTGDVASGTLTANLTSTGQVRSAAGEVRIVESAVDLRKSVAQTDSGELVYTLSMRNNSTSNLLPGELFDGLTFVDGVGEELLLVRDAIPLNTEFSRLIDPVDFDAVYHIAGESEEIWTRIQPVDLASIDAVGFITADPVSPGASRNFSFAVDVTGQGSRLIVDNTAEMLLPDGSGRSVINTSNVVSVTHDGDAGRVAFHDTDAFDNAIDQTRFDQDVFLQVNSGVCNVSAGVDQAFITVTTSPDGDLETVIAVETGANTGIFRSAALRTGDADPVIRGDGVLQGSRRSVASAVVDCDDEARTALEIAPAGAVFLSATNEPIPGATVELLGANGEVIQTTTTDASGFFELFPNIAGVHAIRVTPPLGLVAPSARTNFVGYGRLVDPSASYGAPFTIQANEVGGALNIDIPVDPSRVGTLLVDKQGNKRTAQIGNVIEYTVDVRNTSAIAIQNSEIVDELPHGLSFVPGSALLNGAAFADPENYTSKRLVFPVSLIAANGEANLVYSAVVDANAGEGDAINRAYATGTVVGFNDVTRSNVASHTLNINNSGGVFSRKGVILGKLFMDCDGDGEQQNEDGAEPGIPGVMLHTQNGLSVVTDEDGNYSIPGLDPKTHVLDVYEPSLPEGAMITSNRVMDARAPGSRFVPLRAGEIRSEDFAVEACAADTLEDVRGRIDTALARINGLAPNTGTLALEGRAGARRLDHSDQAEGVILQATETQSVSAGPKLVASNVELKDLIAGRAASLDFVDLVDGDQLVQRVITVRVAGSAGETIHLVHNGEGVSGDRLGRQAFDNGVQVSEFVAVELRPGENVFTLTALDDFGNVRQERTISVTAPGRPAGIEMLAPPTAPADPSRRVPITLQVVDAAGRPAASSVEVTLLPGDDAFDARDVSDQAIGQQVLLTDGYATIGLIPSDKVGTRTLRVTSPLGDAEVDVKFIANTDSADIAVGYVEGAYNLKDSDGIPGVLSKDRLSIFEDTEEGVEANFYLKGEVFKDTLLTMRYESDKDLEDALFRSDEPDEFYPVYGDRSSRGYDAQSSGKGFAMLERGTSYIMYGDVSYAATSSAVQLGGFQRAMEGGMAHFEAGNLRVDGYYGKTDTGQTIVEIPARGVSGPYEIGFGEVIQNSEVVEIVTRDREQPEVIINVERVGRFSAYTLDYFSRTLIFTRPIASRDEDLNPVSIRVTFETETGSGEEYEVYGAEAAFDLTDWMTIGARQLTADAPEGSDDRRTVRAAFADVAIGETGKLQVEVASTENGVGETGDAARLSFEQTTEQGSYGARIAVSDETFDAPAAAISSGREEARLHANRRVGETGTLSAEAIYSAAKQQGTERIGVVGRYEAAVSEALRVRAGSRYVTEERSDGASEDAMTVIAGLVWSPEWMKGGSIDLEAEQEVTDGSASRFAIGADYAISPKWRLYAQGEYSGSRSGEFGLAENFNQDVTFRGGTEYRFSENFAAFSEYRANESFFDAGIAQGLTANWAINPAFSVRTRLEHVQPIGDAFPRNTAAGVGFTVEPEEGDRIIDADLEYSAGENGRSTWYAATTWGRQWHDVTLLARNRLAVSDSGDETRVRDRLRMGWAHRPQKDDALNTLVWYEYALDDQDELRENRHIWSVGGERKPDAKLRLRGRVAGQYYSYTGGLANIDVDEVSLLAQAGIDRDVGKRWNLGANISAITDGDFEDQTMGVGAEANFVFKKNAMIGLGYNHLTVNRESLEGLYRKGLFVRLRMKFDQSIWNIFNEE